MSAILPNIQSLPEAAQHALAQVVRSQQMPATRDLLGCFIHALRVECTTNDLDDRPHHVSRLQGATRALEDLLDLISPATRR